MNDPLQHNIRIGTLISGGPKTASIIKQILPYGFESFSITFWQTLGDVDLQALANDVRAAMDGSGATIGSLSVFGNPLEATPIDLETLRGWERLIDNAHLFGVDLVTGFTGRLRGQRIDASLPRFKEVFTPLVQRAADKGVKIAFENCDMGGDWNSGDWNIAHNPTAWSMMFDAIPMSNIGLQWEPCHQMVSLIDPMPQLREWVARIFNVHGKDCTIKWDIVRKHGVDGPVPFAFHRTPGFGDCNWSDIISELRWGGYTGSIDIEGYHDPVYRDDLEMMGQVAGLNYLKRCRGGDFVPNPV